MAELTVAPTDRFGLRHARGGPAALGHFARATEGVLAYRADMMTALDDALAEEPDLPAAHALRGLSLLLGARRETVAMARDCLAQAEAARAETADEVALIRALQAGLCRGLTAAAEVLEAHLAQRPTLSLLVKLATGLRFTGGDSDGMLAATARLLPAWAPDMPGYSHVLGCHAFALEEAGVFAEAEAQGRRALALHADDPWAIHAVAHVMEMTQRPAEGIALIEGLRPYWQTGNPFARHVSWHLALFRLEQGDAAAALALYDHEIRPDRSEDNRDLANATALLWRLRQAGVGVGDRWAELAAIARCRREETTLVVASLHRLLALLAVEDQAAAHATVMALVTAAQSGTTEQAWVAAAVGLPLARALVAMADGAAALPLDRIAAGLAPMGGSHAQRDVFVRSLLLACDDPAMADRILAVRRRLKRDDDFVTRLVQK